MRRNRPGKNLAMNGQAAAGAGLLPLLCGPSAEPGKATLFGDGGSSRLGLRRVRILSPPNMPVDPLATRVQELLPKANCL
jgi:hypothetical protein